MKRLLICIALFVLFLNAYSQRMFMNLSENIKWKVWLDKEAEWQNDKLILPEDLDLSKLKVNIPLCGWDSLYNIVGKECFLPTTIEEQFGVSHDWTYHGVSWFYSSFNISDDWNGKRVLLNIAKYNHRIEIFVNEKIVGYDAIGLLPYSCDITSALKNGENKIAFRVTSAGGNNRGWEDFPMIKWGEQYILPDKDYSGIGGEVTLTGVDESYISDVFVKNMLPAKSNNIEIEAEVYNYGYKDVNGTYSIEIIDSKNQKVLFNQNYSCVLQNGNNKLHRKITVPEAKQWTENSPNLYLCKIGLKTDKSEDSYTQKFGFRVFEIKRQNGCTNYYLNGERVRFRSSIDWSIYAFNGMFPTNDVAKRNIEAVKKVGHNSLNFHRRAGDPNVMDYADSLGVYIYEEPGGFHSGGQPGVNIDTFYFARKQIYERLKRMVKRDRNHPSLMIYCLCNEDNRWTLAREMAMRLVNSYDPTRLVVNSSGGDKGGFSYGGVPHIRPYESEIRMDYHDNHTVLKALISLDENDLNREVSQIKKGEKIEHVTNDSLSITYWGEVRCYAGTFNYPLMYSQGQNNGLGYDISMYSSQAKKVKELFELCRLKGMGNGDIKSEFDLTKYAGQGQYYSNGRLGQVIMSNNLSDGYAINGWSPGPDMPDEWFSAMLDQNRNMNSFGANCSYWNRPLQVAIMRLNGKYFNPGDSVKLNIFVINENKLKAGNYVLFLRIKDGKGNYVDYNKKFNVHVEGGDVYAQTICKDMSFIVEPSWKSGYITIEGKLYDGKKIVADGMEQVLLKNRISQKDVFKKSKISVVNWEAAENALREAKIPYSSNIDNASLILMGTKTTEKYWNEVLAAVHKGANLVVQFDSIDSNILLDKGLINTPIKNWGGLQTEFWNGNGSSYIDVFGGNQVMHESKIISTRSWEASGSPRGFYPFRSDYKQRAYGIYFAHQYKKDTRFNDGNNTLVTYGEIEYGKGKILLNTSYWVDENNAFTDLLFFNILDHYNK